jgi:hypothetical protein
VPPDHPLIRIAVVGLFVIALFYPHCLGRARADVGAMVTLARPARESLPRNS